MILLRILGDMSAAHVRVLYLYADPAAVAAAEGMEISWQPREGGNYRLRSVVESLEPELGADRTLIQAVMGDIERFGLTGNNMGTYEEDSTCLKPYETIVGRLGFELLEFVAAIPERSSHA